MKKSNIVTSLTALLSRVRINVVGQLYGSELIAILLFPYRKIVPTFKRYPILANIGFLYLGLLMFLIFSDLVINKTSPQNYVRGWASICFSYISLFFLTYQLSRNKKNILYYLLFYTISFFIFRDSYDDLIYSDRTDTFKIYYMSGVNCIVLLSAYFSRKFSLKFPILIFLVYAVACLVWDARSNGVIFFISALLLTTKLVKIRFTKPRLILIGGALLILLSFSYIFYVDSVLSGQLSGNNSQQLKRVENPYNPVNLLMLGRSEVFVAMSAIEDNPIWGYGSWAEDKTGKYARMQSVLQDLDHVDDSNDLIKSHSIIFTAWLWAGLGGFFCLFAIYVLITKRFIRIFSLGSSPFLVILLPLSLEMIWHCIFSPFGHLRETVPLIFALIIVEYYKSKKLSQ